MPMESQQKISPEYVQEMMGRLIKVRKTIEALSDERSRLNGELGAQKNRLAEISRKCKDGFDCELAELPEIYTQFKEAAALQISKAESILGLQKEIQQDEDGI